MGTIIRNNDLTKLTDNQLQQEREYQNEHYRQILESIKSVRYLISKREAVKIPAWKLIEDLQECQGRWEAIIEEQEFRRIP